MSTFENNKQHVNPIMVYRGSKNTHLVRVIRVILGRDFQNSWDNTIVVIYSRPDQLCAELTVLIIPS